PRKCEAPSGPPPPAGGLSAYSSRCPRAWHRDVASRDTRRVIACSPRGHGQADVFSVWLLARDGSPPRALVTSGQCPRAWHRDPARNDEGRPRAPVANGHGRGELALLVQRRLDLRDLDRLAGLVRLRIAVRPRASPGG